MDRVEDRERDRERENYTTKNTGWREGERRKC